MFAVERKVIQQMTADIEEAAYTEDNDDIQLDESEIADINNNMTGLIDGYIE